MIKILTVRNARIPNSKNYINEPIIVKDEHELMLFREFAMINYNIEDVGLTTKVLASKEDLKDYPNTKWWRGDN